MSEWKWESDSEVGEVAESKPVSQSVLTFFQRLLLGVNLWLAVAAIAFFITFDRFSADAVWQWILGLMLLAGMWRFGRWLWRLLNHGRFRAGMAVAFFFTFNVVVGSFVGLAVVGAILEDEELVERIQTEVRWALLEREASNQDESHLVFGVQSVHGVLNDKRAFETCMETLNQKQDSMRNEAIRILGYYVGKFHAEDAVDDLMITVCMKFEDGKVEELRPYFFKSVSNARKDLRRKNKYYERYCILEKATSPKWNDPGITPGEEAELVRVAMCRIDKRQALVLRKRKHGENDRSIALELGIRQDYVRKLHELGIKSLRDEIEILSR